LISEFPIFHVKKQIKLLLGFNFEIPQDMVDCLESGEIKRLTRKSRFFKYYAYRSCVWFRCVFQQLIIHGLS